MSMELVDPLSSIFAVPELPAPVKANPVILVPTVAFELIDSAAAPAMVVVPPLPPARVMPLVLGIVIDDHVALPAGTFTVSPDAAEVIAF